MTYCGLLTRCVCVCWKGFVARFIFCAKICVLTDFEAKRDVSLNWPFTCEIVESNLEVQTQYI